ncbi:MAG: hypothetical protein NZ898_08040 [Myxococcota bacterium]|nr:hypothetical protein [Myxococcota bacterium]MDW8363175.1 hypothetical protein [Myxococcales bacterium]
MSLRARRDEPSRFATGLLLLAWTTTGACADPVVGARCARGFVAVQGACVAADAAPGDGSADSGAIDAFGDRDGPDVLRDGGATDAPSDHSSGEGGLDAAPHDGRVEPDGGDGGMPDGASGCGLGEMRCGAACVRIDIDSRHCGGCGMECAPGEVCSAGACERRCEAPLVPCGASCVDVARDPDHCGGCDVRCATGICIDGACSGGIPGHVVLIGHDYRNARAAMRRVAGNAVFLASSNPVRVLVYEGDAHRTAVVGVDRAIDQTAMTLGRSWTRTPVTAADEVPARLAESDVFLVYAQRDGTDASLRALARGWATALNAFVRRGSVLVVFDGDARHAGTWQLLAEAGLLEVRGRVDVSGQIVRVVAPADALATGVPLMYSGETTTVRFDTTAETVVIAHDEGPVVIHRVVMP